MSYINQSYLQGKYYKNFTQEIYKKIPLEIFPEGNTQSMVHRTGYLRVSSPDRTEEP